MCWCWGGRWHGINRVSRGAGGRFPPDCKHIGGRKDDLPWGWIAEWRAAVDKVRRGCDDVEDILVRNEIFEARTRGIGIIPGELGTAYGVSGANIRAAGVDWDLRRDGKPYLAYPEVDFKVRTHPDGD